MTNMQQSGTMAKCLSSVVFMTHSHWEIALLQAANTIGSGRPVVRGWLTGAIDGPRSGGRPCHIPGRRLQASPAA